eukprot:2713641-Heterocapsa_arctica.AAC.1
MDQHPLRSTCGMSRKPWDKICTFCSSTGIKCCIDVMIVGRRCSVIDSEATNHIDIGSDHRAVYACLREQPCKRKWRPPHPMRGWKPESVRACAPQRRP